MASWTSVIALLAVLGTSAGLTVGPVRLAHNKRYMSYGLEPSPENSLLECPYTLDDSEDEELAKISWVLWNGEDRAGTYEWSPTEEGKATGLLEGAVNLTRDDGGLELTKLRYNLGGYYSCWGTLSTGQVVEAAAWEALVIDTTSNHVASASASDEEKCEYVVSKEAYAVYPEPTVHCGLYSDTLGGFYDEVTALEWHKVVYSNGSVAYSVKERAFKIDENTPDDVQFLFKVGVTKSDGTYISLLTVEGYSNMWQKRGCPPLASEGYQIKTYRRGRRSCRNEYISYLDPPKETVTCDSLHHAVGHVESMVVVCNESADNYTWSTTDGHALQDGHLQCAKNEHVISGDSSAGMTTSCVVVVMTTALLLRLLHQ